MTIIATVPAIRLRVRRINEQARRRQQYRRRDSRRVGEAPAVGGGY